MKEYKKYLKEMEEGKPMWAIWFIGNEGRQDLSLKSLRSVVYANSEEEALQNIENENKRNWYKAREISAEEINQMKTEVQQQLDNLTPKG